MPTAAITSATNEKIVSRVELKRARANDFLSKVAIVATSLVVSYLLWPTGDFESAVGGKASAVLLVVIVASAIVTAVLIW